MSENEYKGILQKEINKLSSINPRFHRISSMLVDHFYLTIVMIPFIGLFILAITSGVIEFNDYNLRISFLPTMCFVYLNKDFFAAKSPGKRILGYQVINRKNGETANELQCLVRNLTICIIWPLEVIVGYFNPERRIGDFMANTKVVKSDKEKLITIWADLKETRVKPSYFIILIVGILYSYALSLFLFIPLSK